MHCHLIISNYNAVTGLVKIVLCIEYQQDRAMMDWIKTCVTIYQGQLFSFWLIAPFVVTCASASASALVAQGKTIILNLHRGKITKTISIDR